MLTAVRAAKAGRTLALQTTFPVPTGAP
jgi:hypothetical protein